jgi:DNA-binding response OmpR family regulator
MVTKNKILIVDDTPENVDLLRQILKGAGHSALVATDGQSALRIAKQALPQLILLDVMMPGIDGFETCKQLKMNEHTAHIPVIFLTAKTDQNSILKGFEVGGVDYMVKPFSHAEVLARVSTHLQLNQLTQEKNLLIKGLRHSEAQSRLITLHTPQPVIYFNIEGVVTYLNSEARKIFSIDSDEQYLGFSLEEKIRANEWEQLKAKGFSSRCTVHLKGLDEVAFAFQASEIIVDEDIVYVGVLQNISNLNSYDKCMTSGRS